MAQQDFSISVIGEGETDFTVLESIVLGYTGQKNLLITRLHPKEGEPGNWDKVLKYCAGSEFRSAFLVPDAFVIIQIDSDVFGTENVPKELAIPGIESLAIPEIVMAIKEKVVAQIPAAFYDAVSARILFAIAVHETECWFLPAYFPNDKKKAGNPKSCIDHLNKQLAKANEGFYINGKDLIHYRALCRHFKKKKDIVRFGKLNESLGIFIEELEKLPLSAEDPDASGAP